MRELIPLPMRAGSGPGDDAHQAIPAAAALRIGSVRRQLVEYVFELDWYDEHGRPRR
jgi:hypothetical protein